MFKVVMVELVANLHNAISGNQFILKEYDYVQMRKGNESNNEKPH